MKRIIDSNPVDLDLDLIIEVLDQHLCDITCGLDAFRRLKRWTTSPEIAGVQTVGNHSNTLDPTGIRAGHTLWTNAYAILQSTGVPRTVAELAETMRENGVVSKSADFENTLNSILSKRRDLFNRVAPKVWGLVEWKLEPEAAHPVRPEPKSPVVPLRIANPVKKGR